MKIPKRLWILLGVAVVSALAYSTTIMHSFNGGDSPYTDDTGEFQLALTLWGTAHPTGYPLYLFLGSPFVNLLRLFGMPPALGASLFSMMWTLIAVVGVAMIALRITQRHEDTKTQNLFIAHSSLFIVHCSFFITLVFALTRSIWIHASIAEVYALNMAFEAAIIWLTLDLMEKWDDKRGWLLAFIAGLGVAHHRLIAVGLPVVGLMLLPMALGYRGNKGNEGKSRFPISLVSFFKWFLISIPFFLSGFLPYIDIMRRIASDSTWIYGKTDSWEKMWNILIATEYSGLQRPNFDLITLWQNFLDVVNVLGNEMTWVGFGVAVLGTVFAVLLPHPLTPLSEAPFRAPDDKNQRRYQEGGKAILFLGIALSYLLFTILFRKAVMIEANLMFVSLSLLLGAASGLSSMLNHEELKNTKNFFYSLGVLRFFVVFSLFAWATALFIIHRDSILALTRNPQSIDYVSQIEKIEAPPNSYIMAPWGWRYFGLSYANRIEGRLKGFTVIDHNADYGELAKTTNTIYTYYDTFFIFTENDFWRSRWGQVYLSSAGPNIVRISRAPILRGASTSFITFGDGIGLISVDVHPTDKDGITDVVLMWTATAKPSRDYSTFVHFSDAEQISSDEDIILKHDQAAPVYAWRATTTWTPNEVIREDHSVKLLTDRQAKLIVVGMYYRNDKGEFVDLKRVEVRLRDGKWEMEK